MLRLTADCDDGAPGIVRKHECIFAGSHREDCRVGEEKGLSKSETARRFSVDRATLKRYCKQLCKQLYERGTLQPRKAPAKRPKLDEKARKLLLEDLQQRPWATHSQRERRSFLPSRGGEGERSDDLPDATTYLTQSKKRSREEQQNETSS